MTRHLFFIQIAQIPALLPQINKNDINKKVFVTYNKVRIHIFVVYLHRVTEVAYGSSQP